MSGQSPLLSFGHEGMHFGFVFFFFMLLATGGILEAYWRDATLTTDGIFPEWRPLFLALFPPGDVSARRSDSGGSYCRHHVVRRRQRGQEIDFAVSRRLDSGRRAQSSCSFC